MRATTFQHGQQGAAQPRSDQPLAQSVFSGESRLRELEHLEETARKVRDQAAAELKRSGGTHHIARDRIAAAERMLAKASKEIAELRAQKGQNAPAPAPKPQAPKQSTDFELAVLLGHSKARFNLDGAAQAPLEMQPAQPKPIAKSAPAPVRTQQRSPAASKSTGRRRAQPSSAWRAMAVALFIALGVGLGATATFLALTSESVPDAAEKVRDSASQAVAKIKTVVPPELLEQMTTPAPEAVAPVIETSAPTDLGRAATVSPPAQKKASLDPFTKRINEDREQQVRRAAAQRLAEQLAALEHNGSAEQTPRTEALPSSGSALGTDTLTPSADSVVPAVGSN